MDRKSIIVLLFSFVLLMLWVPLVNWLFPPLPARPGGPNPVAPASNQMTSTVNSLSPVPPVPTKAIPPLPGGDTWVRPDAPEQLLVVEKAGVRYTFTSHGGGLKLVELTGYRETIACGRARKSDTNGFATLNTQAPVPVLNLLSGEAGLDNQPFTLTRIGDGVRAEKQLTNGLSLVKEFYPGSNYLLQATVRFVNRSAQPLPVAAQHWAIGTATPLGPEDTADQLGVFWYDGAKSQSVGQSWFANNTLGCIPGTPREQYAAGQRDVFWAAVHNRFYALATMVPTNQPASQIVVRPVDLPPPTSAELADHPKAVTRPRGFQAALVYPGVTLGPNQSLERQFTLFAGPREYNTLARLGTQFGNNLDLIMDFGGFFGFFAKILLLSMNGLHAIFGGKVGYGWIIIIITIIIKVLFWPLTQISTRSMKRMQTLQPQMKALQEKYKEDPRKMQQKLAEFMKEHKVNPAAGCLPMLVQLPFLIGFFTMLRSAIELRGAGFLWACDLSQPDTIGVIPGLNFPINPLPLLMGASQLWLTRMTPPSPGVDPVQQKIMQYMPLMFLFILYNFSSGLTLYWTVQNLLSVVQMKLTKSKDDAAATGGKAPGPFKPGGTMAPKKKK